MTRTLLFSCVVLFLSSCIKRRTCVCHSDTGVYTGSISVMSTSDKRANEKCYMGLHDTDRETARQAIADGKAGCLVE